MFVDVMNKFFSTDENYIKFYLKLICITTTKYTSINSHRLGIIMNITSKNRKITLSGHGIENNFFSIDLIKFKGNFLCISATKICLNSATVLAGNLSSS